MGDSTTPTTNEGTSAGESEYDTLYFYLSEDAPDGGALNVYESLECTFLGIPFEFNIIGSSHYIRSDAYGFHELASCKQPTTDASSDVVSFPLSTEEQHRSHPYAGSLSRRIHIESNDINCRVVVKDRPLSAFDPDENFDLTYKFAEDAYTTISIGDAQYETWHTYPEFDLALYTRTDFSKSV